MVVQHGGLHRMGSPSSADIKTHSKVTKTEQSLFLGDYMLVIIYLLVSVTSVLLDATTHYNFNPIYPFGQKHNHKHC